MLICKAEKKTKRTWKDSYAKHEQSSHVRGPHITKLILSRHAEDYIALSQMQVRKISH